LFSFHKGIRLPALSIFLHYIPPSMVESLPCLDPKQPVTSFLAPSWIGSSFFISPPAILEEAVLPHSNDTKTRTNLRSPCSFAGYSPPAVRETEQTHHLLYCLTGTLASLSSIAIYLRSLPPPHTRVSSKCHSFHST